MLMSLMLWVVSSVMVLGVIVVKWLFYVVCGMCVYVCNSMCGGVLVSVLCMCFGLMCVMLMQWMMWYVLR